MIGCIDGWIASFSSLISTVTSHGLGPGCLTPGTNTAFEESNAVKILELVKARTSGWSGSLRIQYLKCSNNHLERYRNVAIFKKIHKAGISLCDAHVSIGSNSMLLS